MNLVDAADPVAVVLVWYLTRPFPIGTAVITLLAFNAVGAVELVAEFCASLAASVASLSITTNCDAI